MPRITWIDWLRVTAIFLVIVVHSTEPFYLGGEGSLVLSRNDALWVSFFDSFARACVPLFIIASSFLQFPLHYSTAKFFKKRAARVLIPFAIWTVIYAFVWGEPVQNFRDLLLNFNYAAGHLWFVYMLIGIYLLIPLLSPWADKVSKKELIFYLLICLITTAIPFVREYYGGEAPVIYGPSGIPNFAKYPLWGESSWNSYGIFYYLSGFIGYLLLGLYIRRFVGELSWNRTLLFGLIPWIIGFIICFFGFYHRVEASGGGQYPVEGMIGMAALWETPWFYDSTGVALMAIGWVLIYKKIKSSGVIYKNVTLTFSNASYGVYLCHMLFLVPISGWFRETLGLDYAGSNTWWATPIEIFCTALSTFLIATFVSYLISRIPRIGKYIMG